MSEKGHGEHGGGHGGGHGGSGKSAETGPFAFAAETVFQPLTMLAEVAKPEEFIKGMASIAESLMGFFFAPIKGGGGGHGGGHGKGHGGGHH